MSAARARGRTRLAASLLALAVGLPAGGCVEAATPLDADILLNDGPGVSGSEFRLRGRTLTAVLAQGPGGSAAGVFRLELGADDPLLARLAGMPAAVSGPPPVPGMPTISIELRSGGSSRRLLGTRPPADPWLAGVMNELGRLGSAARRRPVLTVSVLASLAPASREPARVVLRLEAAGDTNGEARVDLAALRLESAPIRPAPRAGVTALPPEWTPAGRGAAGPTWRVIAPGRPLEIRLDLPARGAAGRNGRAVYSGPMKLKTAGETLDLAVELTSPVFPFKARPTPSGK